MNMFGAVSPSDPSVNENLSTAALCVCVCDDARKEANAANVITTISMFLLLFYSKLACVYYVLTNVVLNTTTGQRFPLLSG